MTFCVHLIRANTYWLSADGGLWAGCCLWFQESSAAGPKGLLLLPIHSLPMRRNLSPWPQLTPRDMLINTEYLSHTLALAHTVSPYFSTKKFQIHMCLQSHTRTRLLPHIHVVEEKHKQCTDVHVQVHSVSIMQAHTFMHTHTEGKVNIQQKMMQVCWNPEGLQQKTGICFCLVFL